MRVLVIGGNGYIGSPLVRELWAAGHKVAVFHRANSPAFSVETFRIRGNRNRLHEYQSEFQRFAPDVIIDLILTTGEQARNLAAVASSLEARVVAISSMDVYRAWGVLHGTEPGPLEPLPITEESALRSVRRLYSPATLKQLQNTFTWLNEDYDKIAMEEVIMNAPGVRATVLRLPMVYGPGDRLHRLFPLLKRIADGRSSIIVSEDLAAWKGARGYVENVAHAIAVASLAERAANRVYNYCDEPVLTEFEWEKRIASQMNWSGNFVVLQKERTPKHLLQQGNAAQHVVASSDRIRTELGYREIVEVEEAINRTAAWERQNPPDHVNEELFDYVAEDAAIARAA